MLGKRIEHQHYRPEIDGLRAIAIIPVVMFHAELFGFSGGFVGVDIFFVISGYLITSIIMRKIEDGSFSFVEFWERRIRRIVPALVVVLTATFVVSYYLILYPYDFQEFGQSLFAQSLFLANMYFMRESGYFAAPAESMPLLHTWSLSVEEQFYILFPLVLVTAVFLLKKKKVVFLLGLLAAVSLALCLWMVDIAGGAEFRVPFMSDIWGSASNVTAAFYLLPTRAWELLLGAIIALLSVSIASAYMREALSFAGLAAILYAVFTFDMYSPFPGARALVPTIGAACIIVSNNSERTTVGSMLSLSPFVWVGLISYSLYLWHWPIFTLSKIHFVVDLSLEHYIPLIVLSVLLAWATYWFVETPFRARSLLPHRKHMIACGLSALIGLAAVGFYFQKAEDDRILPQAARIILEASEDENPRKYECLVIKKFDKTALRDEPCIINEASDAEPTFVLWGDSHAEMFMSLIEKMAKERDVKGAFFASTVCLPVPGTSAVPEREDCARTKRLALDYISDHNIKKVILASRWRLGIEEDAREGDAYLLVDEDTVRRSESDARRVLRENLTEMAHIFELEDRELYLIKQVPLQFGFTVRSAFYRAARDKDAFVYPSLSYGEHMETQGRSNEVLGSITSPNVHVIDPATILCPAQKECLFQIGGDMLYRDDDHLSYTGIMYLEPLFLPFFSK